MSGSCISCISCTNPQEGRVVGEHRRGSGDRIYGKYMCAQCGPKEAERLCALGARAVYVAHADMPKEKAWSPEQWPDSCPQCGREHDHDSSWYRDEPDPYPDRGGTPFGHCWDCGFPHPVLGKLDPEAFR